MPENNITIAAGYTLENISRTIGAKVIPTMYAYINSKLGSENWGDRYVAMIAMGAIIDGPSYQDIVNMIGQQFLGFLELINDSVPRVRQTVAFVFYKISEFVPQLIFQSDINLKTFIDKCIEHCDEHQLICNLIVGTFKHLFINAQKIGPECMQMLNPYFSMIFMKLMEIMYREDIHQANELQNISDAINDITDNADHISLKNEFNGYLTMILQELANCLDPNIFRLKNLNSDQKESFQNFLGSLIQILLYKCQQDLTPDLT